MHAQPEEKRSAKLTMADLAVVIPSHSQVDSLHQCLTSLTRFGDPGMQVLVVDDGSKDGMISRLASSHAGIEVIRRENPGGFCRAANLGIARVIKPVVQLLNDDAEVTEGWAGRALDAFRQAKVGAVAPLVLIAGAVPARVDSAGDRFNLAGIVGKSHHGQVLLGMKTRKGRWVLGASASSAFYRTEAIRRAGLFDESFGAYFEDVDLSFRLQRAGWRIWHEPGSVVYHQVSASYGKFPGREILEIQSRNEERLFWRHMPGLWLMAGIPFHLAALGAKGYKHLRNGTFREFISGKSQAWWEYCQGLCQPGKHASDSPWSWQLDLW